MDKKQWVEMFRKEAEKTLLSIGGIKDKKKKSEIINQTIKQFLENNIKKITNEFKEKGLTREWLLNEILLATYASYIVMLEYRNTVWPYDYMSFARRIGELWEPFCKIPFTFSLVELEIVEPHDFKELESEIRNKTTNFISTLSLNDTEKKMLEYYFNIPWSLVDSGGIKLKLDLHFKQGKNTYNCDFKSGFSSNEKGNTNRLLLVGSIYQSMGEREKAVLFVRQEEDENNHYLQTLKKSPYWNVFCAEEGYAKMAEFTGFNLRNWLDVNADWKNDISIEFRNHLENNDLIRYLTW